MNKIADDTALLAMPETDYMGETQLRYFQRKLMGQKAERQARVAAIRTGIVGQRCWGDAMDRAVAEADQDFLLEQATRDSQALREIDAALERIRNHSYGYCAISGQPIGLRRLLANPTTALSYVAQQQTERHRRRSRHWHSSTAMRRL